MTVIRTIHNKANPYVILNKVSLWDENLSLAAVGLWSRLMSRPDNWLFRVNELAKSAGVSHDTINRLIRELIKNGYAYRYPRMGEKGRKAGWEILVFEVKKTEAEIKEIINEIKEIYPERKKPCPEKCVHTNTSSFHEEDKEEAAKKKKKELPAPLSIEEQIKKSSIPIEEQEAALDFFKSNPEKFGKAKNPMGLLVTIVNAGEHRIKKRISQFEENKEWAKEILLKSLHKDKFHLGKSSVSIETSPGMPDKIIKYEDVKFKEIITDRLNLMESDRLNRISQEKK